MFHLAQANIARALYPLDDPAMHGFVSRLAEINGIAESSPGFVWRYTGDAEGFDDRTVFNLSVWESLDALKDFTYKSLHRELFRDRQQWFEKQATPTLAMWWIPQGHIPTVEEAKSRLDHIRVNGESEFAFTFRNLFQAQHA